MMLCKCTNLPPYGLNSVFRVVLCPHLLAAAAICRYLHKCNKPKIPTAKLNKTVSDADFHDFCKCTNLHPYGQNSIFRVVLGPHLLAAAAICRYLHAYNKAEIPTAKFGKLSPRLIFIVFANAPVCTHTAKIVFFG